MSDAFVMKYLSRTCRPECLSLSAGLMETLSTVGKLSTEQSSAPPTTLSMCVKSCSPLRGWKVSPSLKLKSCHKNNKEDFMIYSVHLRFASSPTGSLEDWDLAVQKTETRLNRVNEQRAKVGSTYQHCTGRVCHDAAFLLMSPCSALLSGG